MGDFSTSKELFLTDKYKIFKNHEALTVYEVLIKSQCTQKLVCPHTVFKNQRSPDTNVILLVRS